MTYLIDTNIILEIRKGGRCDPNVAQWYDGIADDDLHLSVLALGEIRQGIERSRRRDPDKAKALDRWLVQIYEAFDGRILPIDSAVADIWGQMNVPDRISTIDGLMAATAKVHGLTLVTRNIADVTRSGAALLNPFDPPAA